ncbi:hypothetical protein C2845_PM18G09660 [Panicum miliaceum]|uniref:Disease resistance R13L4/SHOC-2-like LRR domain-containing protein n=1 Tax=Panicum miliaceum TaxID=4540 RepID=A0A3L6PLH1_PANMI|nr:hypothetical protein C2845_PM18G09660 [Panicum miliaceum]
MLTGLRKLGVTGINKKNGPAFRSAISSLSRLESLSGEELGFKSRQAGIAFKSLRVLSLADITKVKTVKFEEGTMPKLERLQVTGELDKEIGVSGLEFLPRISEVHLGVNFLDWERIIGAEGAETWHKIRDEEIQEERRKKGELKKKIQEQLARNTNEPTVTNNSSTSFATRSIICARLKIIRLPVLAGKGSQSGKDSVERTSSSDAATTSGNDCALAPFEITEDQSKDAAEKEVKRTLTRIRTSVGDLEESHLIGRDKKISDIIDLISNKDSQCGQVISVWRMGGLGKTNASQRLLEIKSCLIVLDDLSSIAEWDEIMQGFCWIGKTTRIILTTRKENIEHHCSRNDETVRNLEVLKEEDAVDLFSQKALPKTIIKLQKLQYIHAGRQSDYVREEKGVYEERGAVVPRGVRKLKGLDTLREVNVGRGNAILQDIKMLTGLRKLGVSGINKKNGPAFRYAISSLSRLESLSVRSVGGKPGLHGCVDGISSPRKNLKSLKLYGNLETLPEWIRELPHLVKLKLAGTRLSEHDAAMELLGKLPKLEILILSLSSFQGEELGFKSPQAGIAFGSLRVLSLVEITKVKSVNFEEGVMPKLERLQNFFQASGKSSSVLTFDWERILAAVHSKTRDMIFDEVKLEEAPKRAEFKKKIQDQLARNANEPIVTVY